MTAEREAVPPRGDVVLNGAGFQPGQVVSVHLESATRSFNFLEATAGADGTWTITVKAESTAPSRMLFTSACGDRGTNIRVDVVEAAAAESSTIPPATVTQGAEPDSVGVPLLAAEDDEQGGASPWLLVLPVGGILLLLIWWRRRRRDEDDEQPD
jgi:hypothetical protein